MGRPHLEFIRSAEVEPEPLDLGPFAGLGARILSRDDETGAQTALVELPDGWSGDLADAERRPLELFVLRGELELGGRPVREAAYAFVPAGAKDAEATVHGGALLVAMLEEPRPDLPAGGAVELIDTHEMRIAEHGTPGVPPGLLIKLLRVDEERGDWTWICSGAPGWQEDRAEIHPTVEEALVLRGDVLLGTHGEMGPGDYFWRPPNVLHGPMYSRNGNYILFRTKGGSMEVSYQDVPSWREQVERYRDDAPFYAGD